jgi:hypothetical protein
MVAAHRNHVEFKEGRKQWLAIQVQIANAAVAKK